MNLAILEYGFSVSLININSVGHLITFKSIEYGDCENWLILAAYWETWHVYAKHLIIQVWIVQMCIYVIIEEVHTFTLAWLTYMSSPYAYIRLPVTLGCQIKVPG